MRWGTLVLVGSVIAACQTGAGDAPPGPPCTGPACTGAGSANPDGGPSATTPPAPCTDGQKNNDETDVDCGGACPGKCAPAHLCKIDADCTSVHCVSGTCAPPSCTDGIKNQDESDVDCGGGCGKCAPGAACNVHADCQTDGCDYKMRCALARSCTAHHGGDTCGPGPDGDANGVFENCCTALPVTRGDGTTVQLDKYVITAGRMRAFVERYNGNLRQFITDANPPTAAWWDPAWKANVPASLSETLAKLGPYPDDGFTRQGCNIDGGGARTYWQPPIDPVGSPNEKQAYGQDVLDEKALNCAEIFTFAAFCLWDGGHLATSDDLIAAWGPGPYPWGATPAVTQTDTDPQSPIYGYVVHEFGAEFDGPYSYTWPEDELDQSVHIAAPGRRPLGKGPSGHMDLAGLVFQMSSGFGTAPNGSVVPIWLDSGSWEAHGIPAASGSALAFVSNDSFNRAYWAAGARCAR